MSIAEKITELNTVKNDIFSALETKGVTVPENAGLSVVPALIGSITNSHSDIPDEYKDSYQQVNYIKTSSYYYAQFDDVSFSNDDIIKLQYGVVYLRDSGIGLISSRTGINHSGTHVQDFEVNNAYYPNNMMMNYTSSEKSKMISGLTGVVQNSEIEFVLNYPNMIKDGNVTGTLDSGASSRTAQTICLFEHDSGDKGGAAIGIVEIIDKITMTTKYKFIPSKNKNTNQYGWFEIVNHLWSGDSHFSPWSPA